MSFIDTNVLVDILSADPIWKDWSKSALRAEAMRGADLATNGIVYAEIAGGFVERRALDAFLVKLDIAVLPVSRQAFFLAGQAFGRFRDRSKTRTTILPDFIIGAHAAELGMPLVTRDPRRFRTYFPDLALITP